MLYIPYMQADKNVGDKMEKLTIQNTINPTFTRWHVTDNIILKAVQYFNRLSNYFSWKTTLSVLIKVGNSHFNALYVERAVGRRKHCLVNFRKSSNIDNRDLILSAQWVWIAVIYHTFLIMGRIIIIHNVRVGWKYLCSLL